MMNRRRFVVVAAATTVAGAALAVADCSSPTGQTPIVGPTGIIPGNGTVLNVQYAYSTIGGKRFHTRTYNGRTYGPTIETRGGETLHVKIVNRLPPNPPYTVPMGRVAIPKVRDVMEAMDPNFHGPTVESTQISATNNPHGFNTTNLHTHGIQTVPHLFNPIGTSNPKADMIEIEPGQTFSYALPVPPNQPSGLYWYHPHKHGSTDVQVSNGMAGFIVVRGAIDEVPEIKAAREIFVIVQTLDVNPAKHDKNLWVREYVAYETPKNGGYNLGTDFTMLTTNGQGIAWVNNNKSTIEPLPLPEFKVAPGEVVRLRFLNGTNYLPMPLALPGFETYAIAFDGVNLLEATKVDMSGAGVAEVTPANMGTAPIQLAMSANRLEFMLRAPKEPGSYVLSSLATNGLYFEPYGKVDVARFVVSGAPVTMAVPGKLPVPTREYPVITEKEIVRHRKLVYAEGPSTKLLTGFEFTLDGVLYDMMDATIRPQLGTCEEWRIENSSSEGHSFHIHVNSFQLIAVNDKPVEPMEVWDTFIVPPKTTAVNGSITMRIRFQEWVGKTVFHCHILPHEDTGMMKNFLIT
jgi:suppressor of ftsI